MWRWFLGLLVVSVFVVVSGNAPQAYAGQGTYKPGPPKSGFDSFWDISPEFEVGIGNVSKLSCTVGQGTQPSEYSGNMLVDCDGEVPHNETSIAVDPNDPGHAIGAYHSYQLSLKGSRTIARIIGTTSVVTFDGGNTWREVVPPITPYEFTGDPALAFASSGRVYFANIADHEGQGGGFTAPSVIVARSDDGGRSWSNPVTVAKGVAALAIAQTGPVVFQDKQYIAVDTGPTSPFRDRAYVTWTSFQWFSLGKSPSFRSPIMVSYSDDGVN